MSIGAPQLIAIVLIITGIVGARRGWAREVITAAILLATLAFLMLGGAAFILHFLSGDFVATASAHGLSGGGPEPGATSGASSGGSGPSSSLAICASTTAAQALSNLIFVSMTWLGYWAGSKYGHAPKNGTDRLIGILPGIVNGAVIMYYVSQAGLLGRKLIVESPSQDVINASLPALLALGLLGLLVVLFVSSQKTSQKASS